MDRLELELVESALRGNISSFGELCERYYNSLVALAYSTLADHHLAEDAAQETFTRALGKLKNLKNKEKFGYWLAAICRNISRDMIKTKVKHRKMERVLSCENRGNDGNQNQASLQRASQTQPSQEELLVLRYYYRVREAIDKLPLTQKELVMLRYYSSMSHEQMSSVSGLSKAAVNNRLVRARKRIADDLRNSGFGEVRL